ncbi:MAG: glycosyltransferase family 9 protein [Gemmatimonadaceae bacterium]
MPTRYLAAVLKGLERIAKRIALGSIAALMGRSQRGVRPDWRHGNYRVLFLRHDRIGDMILSTGILRAIAESYPTVQLDVLASKTNAPVLINEPYLHEVIPFDRKAASSFPGVFRDLRRRKYDAVIDCMVTAPSLTTLLLMLASGARYRIGVARRGNDFAYTLPVPPREAAEHIVDKLGTLVTAFGLQPTALDLRPRVRLTAEENTRGERIWTGDATRTAPRGVRLLVNVSAGRAHHFWPDDRFVAVIRAAREQEPGAEILVVGSPSDRARAARIAAEGGARLVEDEGIRDAMAIVSRADVVFTPDTSISHVCSAFGKPAVVLHPRGFAALWGPYETDGRAIESRTDSVADITADEAARVLVRRLASPPAKTAW